MASALEILGSTRWPEPGIYGRYWTDAVDQPFQEKQFPDQPNELGMRKAALGGLKKTAPLFETMKEK
jgi:hypothetical protein